MKPRPFYRSRLFWLGLPGLVFLLWGWWISTGNLSWTGFLGAGSWMIGQIGGEVFAMWDSDGGPDWGSFFVRHAETTGKEAQEWTDSMVAESERRPSFSLVFIPYYWPVLAYTATWLLTLAWWQRRKARKMKLHSPP